MRVLVTNDDGIDSAGLAVLARAAVDAGCDVIVAAPARESSGTSASLVGAELDGRLIIDEKAAPDFELLLLQVVLAVIGVTLAARLTGKRAT
ncbi:MAG: hypothetical protein H7269_03260 [Cellulomonas sp.]|nr:hypothetical protein [Cellulomonas sp.]